jgi:hypothetical protein
MARNSASSNSQMAELEKNARIKNNAANTGLRTVIISPDDISNKAENI